MVSESERSGQNLAEIKELMIKTMHQVNVTKNICNMRGKCKMFKPSNQL